LFPEGTIESCSSRVGSFAAGIYGIAVIAPQYFMEAQVGRDYPPAITHPEYFYGFVGVGLAGKSPS